MAKGVDSELIQAVKNDSKVFLQNGGLNSIHEATIVSEESKTGESKGSNESEKPPVNSEPVLNNAHEGNKGENKFQQVPEQKDELKDAFDDLLKGLDLPIGTMGVEFVDDLKCSLLLMFAHKNGLTEMKKEHFVMSDKLKKVAAMLVEYGTKGKVLEMAKKYPLLFAALLVGVTAVPPVMLINSMSKNKKEAEDLKKKNEDLSNLYADLQKKFDALNGAQPGV